MDTSGRHRKARRPGRRARAFRGGLVALSIVGSPAAVAGALTVPGTASAATVPFTTTAAVARALAVPCTTPTSPEADLTVPIGVVADATVSSVFIGVCIAGQGPFLFALDSGTSDTLVARGLANDLALTPTGKKVDFGVVGCGRSTAQPVAVGQWSAGGVALLPQSVVSGSIGAIAPGINLDGLLGSDVLARFGAVRIDYDNQTASFESAESTALAAPTPPSQSPPSSFDLAEAPVIDSGARIVVEGGRVLAIATVSIARRKYQFVVDTGAQFLSVGPALAKAVKLRAVSSERLSGANCGAHVSAYIGGAAWKLGGVGLGKQFILGVPSSGADFGLLGLPVLSRYGAVVIDYAGGWLLLSDSIASR